MTPTNPGASASLQDHGNETSREEAMDLDSPRAEDMEIDRDFQRPSAPQRARKRVFSGSSSPVAKRRKGNDGQRLYHPHGSWTIQAGAFHNGRITPAVRATHWPEPSEFDPFFQNLAGEAGLDIAQDRIDLARLYTVSPLAEDDSDSAERPSNYVWRNLGLVTRLNIIQGLEEIERMAEFVQFEGQTNYEEWDKEHDNAASVRDALQSAQFHLNDPYNWWEHEPHTPVVPETTIQTSAVRTKASNSAQVNREGNRQSHDPQKDPVGPEPDDSNDIDDLDSDDSDFSEDDDEDEKKGDNGKWEWEPEELDWCYDKLVKWINDGGRRGVWSELGWGSNSLQYSRLKQHHRKRFHGEDRHQPRFHMRNKTDHSKKADLKPRRETGTRRKRLAFYRRFLKIKEFRDLIGYPIPAVKSEKDPVKRREKLEQDAKLQNAPVLVEWRKLRADAGKTWTVRYNSTYTPDDTTAAGNAAGDQLVVVASQSVGAPKTDRQASALEESKNVTGAASAEMTDLVEPSAASEALDTLPLHPVQVPAPILTPAELGEPARRRVSIDEEYDDSDDDEVENGDAVMGVPLRSAAKPGAKPALVPARTSFNDTEESGEV
ncbi:hypothetical protein FKW77_000882 [Venturia effusa]|uniref:Uncharacterized protein n=1 Tax=Venturia effusa TaxID=50376 RepID=A0A517LPF1_9PEZI|nr:hypothetical protein FKW77_000882 [Venturia effusa]